jgi:ATP-dependent protease ClpP protease subunit
VDVNSGNVFYIEDFDEGAARDHIIALTKAVQTQRQFKEGRIDLYINSAGGYMYLVQHLIELVEIAKRDGVVVRTIVPYMAFSAGSMLAITGTPGERYIARDAEHVIHYGTTLGTQEETPKQIERWSGYKARDFKKRIAHYEKYAEVPGLDAEMMDNGFSVPAQKCIKWGLADKYLDKFDIMTTDN